MRWLISTLMACCAAAQSPHVFRPAPEAPGLGPAKFEGRVVEFSISGNIIKEDTENIANRTLFKSTRPLKKRVAPLDPTPDEQSAGQPRPLFRNPACMRCPNKRDLTSAEGILSIYTTEYFETNIFAEGDTLKDKCIFYTRGLDPFRPVKLSREATRLACAVQKYTIWHLWSNENDEKKDYKQYMNHYDPFNARNRLNKLATQPVELDPVTQLPERRPFWIEYFENMSRALAHKCHGKIYLYTTEPLNVGVYWNRLVLDIEGKPAYPNIWATTESVALQAGRNDVRELIAIDAKSTAARPPAYEISWGSWARVRDATYRRAVDEAAISANYSADNLPPWAKPYDLWGEVTTGPKTEKETLARRDAPPFCLDFEINEGDIDLFG